MTVPCPSLVGEAHEEANTIHTRKPVGAGALGACGQGRRPTGGDVRGLSWA